MAINNFTNEEAIEICIQLRDRVLIQNSKERYPIKRLWLEPDALAKVINLAQKQADFERKKK